MQTLLIVLLTGCALALAVHIGRGMWARSRPIERHQQALDTLAKFTTPVEGAPGSHAETGDHQAHVRVIGRSGHPVGRAPALPPPREVTLPGPVRTSAFRRPSHHEPSVAALDAVATSPRLSARSLTRWGRRPPSPPGPPDEHRGERADVTLPGLPPVWAEDPTTRPVPVIQPQVFYFDDVTHATATAPGRRGTGRARRAFGLVPAALVAPGSAGAAKSAGEAGPKAARARRSPVLWPLAIAAVSVAVAGVALGVELRNNPARPAPVASPSTVPHPRSVPSARSTTTSVPVVSTTTPTTASTVPPQPAVLVSANGGTATYQLTSATASIVVKASGPCWIEVKAGSPRGQVVVEETLSAGQRSSVTGPAWIRLGDPPNVDVTVDGTPMSVPGSGSAVPLDLQFTLG
jgi:hypothetical protein